MPAVYVAAGSNIEPEKNLRHALGQLRREFPGLKSSPAYRNPAFGFEGDDFINLVVGFESGQAVHDVIQILHRVEEVCGRPRLAPKWAPRSMDLDILLYGDAVIDEPGLRVPRADLTTKAYMLRPAADLAPDVIHPTLGRSLGELWRAFDTSGLSMQVVEL
ncbi:MAG: 2-amino-4-hydroxy-6-hydroxymethyldihydropteridine diphosphokinase [Steroidobacterales bacterium]